MGVKAEKRWKGYSADFQKFLDFVKLDPDALLAKTQDRKWFEQQVLDFLWIHRQRAEAKEVTTGRVWSFERAINARAHATKCESEVVEIRSEVVIADHAVDSRNGASFRIVVASDSELKRISHESRILAGHWKEGEAFVPFIKSFHRNSPNFLHYVSRTLQRFGRRRLPGLLND